MMHYERVDHVMRPVIASAQEAMTAVGRYLTTDEFVAWISGWGQALKEEQGITGNVVITAYVHAVFSRCYVPKLTYFSYLAWIRKPMAMMQLTDGSVLISTIDYLGHLLHELKLLPLASISSLLSFQAKSSWHLLSYATAKKVYQVSDGLAMQLRDTELRGLLPADVVLPYEAIYLEIPKATGFRIWNTETGWHPAEGVYIVEDQEPELVHTKDGLKHQRSWRFMFIGGEEGRERFDDAIVYFTVALPGDATLDAVIKDTTAAFLAEIQQGDLTAFAPMIECWEGLFRWAFNVVVYATWPNAEVSHITLNKEAQRLWERIQKTPPKSPKRKKLSQEHAELDPRRRIVLGRSVMYIDRSRAEAALSGAHDTVEHTVATRVQGHWKNQAYGEGWALRKRIWVQPYWRGLEDGLPLHNAIHRLT